MYVHVSGSTYVVNDVSIYFMNSVAVHSECFFLYFFMKMSACSNKTIFYNEIFNWKVYLWYFFKSEKYTKINIWRILLHGCMKKTRTFLQKLELNFLFSIASQHPRQRNKIWEILIFIFHSWKKTKNKLLNSIFHSRK